MTTQLSLYNQALQLLKERKLTALDSPAEEKSQIELDTVWDNGATDYCLEQAYWNFATRDIELSYDPDTTPAFGLQYAFNKPSDWKRTSAICSDELFTVPHLSYRDRGSFWYSDLDTLYISYVSNDASYGGDLSLWPQVFVKYVAAYLASEACLRITGSKDLKVEVDFILRQRFDDASNNDVMNEPTKLPPRGRWAAARRGRRYEHET